MQLYYKRVDPYVCSELAHVLEGSGSRRRYPRKVTSVDRVSVVFVAHVDRRIFLLFVKNVFVDGTRHGWRAEEGLSEEGREKGREASRRYTLYPEDGTGQYTVYSQSIP